MSGGGQRQHLAAILAADAAGYSRLMEADERATLAALDARARELSPEVEANSGRVINTAGDSVLAVFDTAAGAVTAALGDQRALERSSSDSPEARRLRFRIGVHLGDVIETADGDVHGDGVNIAARLQALAAPGGIVVSEAVRGAVKTRVAATFDDLGAQAVKNIADPVRAFAVADPRTPPTRRQHRRRRRDAPHGVVAGGRPSCSVVASLCAWSAHGIAGTDRARAAATKAPPRPWRPGKPSIAVLPFDNMSGDADKAYFADGMTEDLITDLSKVGGLVVIARNSTFQYKGKARDVREIGKALNARYVLEGSVRRQRRERARQRAADRRVDRRARVGRPLRRRAQEHLHAAGHDRAQRRQGAVGRTDEGRERARREARHRQRPGLRHGAEGLGALPASRRRTSFKAAIADFKKATEIDPGYGRAWAALAAIHWEIYTRYWGPALGLSRDTQADRGAVPGEGDARPDAARARGGERDAVHAQQHAEAIAEAQRAVASDPNDADGYVALAGALSFAGRPAEALEAVERAMRLNPHYPSSYAYQRGLALFGLNRLDEAAASLERAIEINPDDYWSQRLLLAVYGLSGRRDDALRLAETIRSNDRARALRWPRPAYDPRRHILVSVRQAGGREALRRRAREGGHRATRNGPARRVSRRAS